jgi:hypothetical protein
MILYLPVESGTARGISTPAELFYSCHRIKHTLSGHLHSLELHRRCDLARSIYKLLSDQENGSTNRILGLEACVPVDLQYIN